MQNTQQIFKKICKEYAENMQKKYILICQICRICHKISIEIFHKILRKICKKYAEYAKQNTKYYISIK
jgi:hypothetical protein